MDLPWQEHHNIVITEAKDYFFENLKCTCSAKSKQHNSHPYYYATAYCPTHSRLFIFRWLDKAKLAPPALEHEYHLRLTFYECYPATTVNKIIREFIRLVRKKHPNMLHFGRLHYGERAGLHIHFSIKNDNPVERDLIWQCWRQAHFAKTKDEPLNNFYFGVMTEDWTTNCFYILSGWGKDKYDPQLPPYGKYKRLVRCAKLFMPTPKKQKRQK